ncbi:MAG: hypothetical protein Kow0037_00460 [Calditrichia bacterium]
MINNQFAIPGHSNIQLKTIRAQLGGPPESGKGVFGNCSFYVTPPVRQDSRPW